MTTKVLSIIGDYCCVKRQGDSVICFPKGCCDGLKLSDDRMRILFNVYAQLIEQERRKKNDT